MLDRLCPDGYAVMSETGKQQRNKQKGEKDTFTRGCGWCHTGHTRHSFLVSYDSTIWHIHDKHMKVQRRRTVWCLVGRQGSPSDVGEANWCLLSVSSCGDIIMGDSRRVNFRWACCSQQAVTGSHRRGNTRASWWKDDWRASLVSSLHVLRKHTSSKFPKHTKNSG